MDDLYENLDRSLYKETSTEDGSDTSFKDPTLFSLDNVVEFGQFRKISINGVLLTVSRGDDIQKEINKISSLGGGEVRLAEGIHFPTTDIIVPSDIVLSGTGASTVIDFQGAAFGVRCVGELIYNTGTVSINNESTSVTGSGTTWTAAMEGSSMLIGEFWYVIATVNSTTSITLESGYQATNVSGVSYIIANTIENPVIKDLTIQNSSVSLVTLQYTNGGTFKNLLTIGGDIGIEGLDSSFFEFDTCSADSCDLGMEFFNFRYGTFFNGNTSNCTIDGLTLIGCSNWGIEISSSINNDGEGLVFENCSNIGFEDFTVDSNDGAGIRFISGNSEISLNDGAITNNAGNGIELAATTDRCQIMSTNIRSNGGWGVQIAASTCDNNIIVGNNFSSNASGAISDSGTATIIVGNAPNSLNTTTPPGAANTALSNLSSVAINTSLLLGTSDNGALGSISKMWSDLFLASGAVVNFNNGNATLTHSAGLLTSNVDIVVPDEAYGSGWNGSTEVPTKNAVYDKIETLSGSSCLTAIPMPVVPSLTGASTQTGFGTNTTQSLYQFHLPYSITVNKISIKTGGTVTTSGTFDLTIYSEDGQTQKIAVTTGTVSVGDTIITTSVSGVVLSPGIYWFSIVPNGTASSQFYCYTQGSNAALANTVSLATDVSSEPVVTGTLTVTASTPATTFTPSSVTESTLTTVGIVFRLDN